MEFTAAAQRVALVVTLPLPDGSVGRFQVQETQLMAPELAAKFPEIRTWTGQGIDDPVGHGALRLDAAGLPRDGALDDRPDATSSTRTAAATRRTT